MIPDLGTIGTISEWVTILYQTQFESHGGLIIKVSLIKVFVASQLSRYRLDRKGTPKIKLVSRKPFN